MKKSLTAGVIAIASALTLAIGVFSTAQAVAPEPLHSLRVWASVGAGAELDGATVKVQSRTGAVLATGTTSNHGTYVADLSASQSTVLPLTVTTSGGKAGREPFTGHLKAMVHWVGPHHPLVYLDLVSTAATRMVAGRGSMTATRAKHDYRTAFRRVRRTLGIHPDAPMNILHNENRHVHVARLFRTIHAHPKGFDGHISDLADMAKAGTRYHALERPHMTRHPVTTKPAIHSSNQLSPAANLCPATLPNASVSNKMSSSTIIGDVGSILIGGTLLYMTGSAAVGDGVAFMFLHAVGGATPPDPNGPKFAAVMKELGCISSQISALSGQVTELALQQTITRASDCASALEKQWSNYTFDISNAGKYPLDSTNGLLMTDLANFNAVTTNCGSSINDMLWGTGGGLNGAWTQLVSITENGAGFLTQPQVQKLQGFLSYWGMLEYEQMVLSTEYDNFYGYAQGSARDAGLASPQPVGATTPVCETGSTATSETYCVWASNLANAFPPDLYSDEVANIQTGEAITVVSGGLSLSSSTKYSWCAATPSQTAMDQSYWWQTWLNIPKPSGGQTAGFVMTCPRTGTGKWNSTTSFSVGIPVFAAANANGLKALNRFSLPSAIETFADLKVHHTDALQLADLAGLQKAPAGGADATQALLDGYNQTIDSSTFTGYTPQSEWGPNTTYETISVPMPDGTQTKSTYPVAGLNLTVGEVCFLAKDSQVGSDAYDLGFFQEYYLWPGCALGNGASQSNKKGSKTAIPSSSTTLQFGILLGRSWWPGAPTATSYTPPAPPTP